MSASEIYELNPLFEEVQLERIFADGKTFVDCIPQFPLEKIRQDYLEQKQQPGFNLKRFVLTHFILPIPHSSQYQADLSRTVTENIELLWPVLTRQPDTANGSVIPLPYSYVVPGGRFGEIYYWDSYFTMLGLQVSGKIEMIENMTRNFSYLIDRFGYIPNGNRSYFLGRSQPPFFSFMVCMLADIKGKNILREYLPALEKEYRFWMKGIDSLDERNNAAFHSVLLPGAEIMNRYWDEHDSARPESFAADWELSKHSDQPQNVLFRHLRAGAESGWDYSCRWFKNEADFGSIHTTDIIPVDLNGLLYHLEKTIGEAYQAAGNADTSADYRKLSEKRKKAIQQYCWDESSGFYFDYDWKEKKLKDSWTLAGASPLYFQLASVDQAAKIAQHIEDKFLQTGGLASTLIITGQQWDAPNGWAPLHWMTITGLENYGYNELAAKIARRWIKLNNDVYKRTGKLMEKYNVMDTHLEAGGGEYAGQDGFGWTNGVLLALIKKYGLS